MTWVEELVHIAPDGGNETLEFVLFLVVVTAIGGAVTRYLRSSDRSSRTSVHIPPRRRNGSNTQPD